MCGRFYSRMQLVSAVKTGVVYLEIVNSSLQDISEPILSTSDNNAFISLSFKHLFGNCHGSHKVLMTRLSLGSVCICASCICLKSASQWQKQTVRATLGLPKLTIHKVLFARLGRLGFAFNNADWGRHCIVMGWNIHSISLCCEFSFKKKLMLILSGDSILCPQV
jgi:hypothetical protein